MISIPQAPPPEFSKIVDLDSLGDQDMTFALEADAEARSALAARFGLVAIDRFSAEVTLRWLVPGKVLWVWGRVSADVAQTCVVTLDPVRAAVDEEFDLRFARRPGDAADLMDPEDVEPLEGDSVDIGEIAAEELLLSLDPYPRSPNIDEAALNLGPGASLSSDDEPIAESPRKNPFDVLATFKTKL